MAEIEILEALTPSQRRKKAIIFKKSLHKRLRTMKKNKARLPNNDMLLARAQRMARKFVIKRKKLLSPELLSKYPSGLTIAQKNALEKKLAKHSNLVKKMTPKMLKKARISAREKLAASKSN